MQNDDLKNKEEAVKAQDIEETNPAEAADKTDKVAVEPEALESSPNEAAFTPEGIQKLTADYTAALLELENEKNLRLRLAAEYDNFRKRSQKERESLYVEIKAEITSKFLPVYDNLELALKQETSDEAYAKGVEMIMNGLKEILEKLGVEPLGEAGEVFNPDYHSAVMHIEDETLGKNVIAEVFQKGFIIGNKVIRFAMVKVAN